VRIAAMVTWEVTTSRSRFHVQKSWQNFCPSRVGLDRKNIVGSWQENIVGSWKRTVSRRKAWGKKIDGSKGEWLAKKRFRTSQDEMPERKPSGLAEEKGNDIARNKVEKLPGLGEGVWHGRTCLDRKNKCSQKKRQDEMAMPGGDTTKRFGTKGLGKATGLEKVLTGRKGLGKATKGLGRKKKSCRTNR
jgi:hypothetical protein